MTYTHYDLGTQRAGTTVRVTLRGTEANVMLIDPAALAQYRRGGPFTYYGGHTTRSPIFLEVPRQGHWHVVVDLGDFAGSVESAVEILD